MVRQRKLFCKLGPWAYALSTQKCRLVRRAQDLFSGARFAHVRQTEPLPVCWYKHKSLIRRTLGNVDMRLQENKACNLALAAPRVNGVLVRPGETFSFWRLVGPCTARRGYQEGLVIRQGSPASDIGGGMCQFTNLLHWMVLHTPLEIVEHHHHDGVDLFPDFGRQIPFGTGTSILYNYLDYRFYNPTPHTVQVRIWVTQTHLCGELRSDAPRAFAYHIHAVDECFVQEADGVYRCNTIVRRQVDKTTGCTVKEEILKKNHARVLYDTTALPVQNREEPQ